MSVIIRGEYWVTDTNDLVFADGDVGDFNHEGYARETGIGLLLGMFGLDVPDNGHVEDPLEFIAGAHRDELGTWDPQQGPPEIEVLIEAVLGLATNVPEYAEIIGLVKALNGPDITTYFVQKKGWVYVKNDYIAMHKFSPARARKVLDVVFEEEGIEDEALYQHEVEGRETIEFYFSEEGIRMGFSVLDYANGINFEHPRSEIVRVPFSPPPQRVPVVAALRKIDHFEQHPFYWSRKGFPYASSD